MYQETTANIPACKKKEVFIPAYGRKELIDYVLDGSHLFLEDEEIEKKFSKIGLTEEKVNKIFNGIPKLVLREIQCFRKRYPSRRQSYSKIDICIAGGYLRDIIFGIEPRDIDVFCRNNEVYKEFTSSLKGLGVKFKENKHNTIFYFNGYKNVQVISRGRDFVNASILLSNFDSSLNMVALYPKYGEVFEIFDQTKPAAERYITNCDDEMLYERSNFGFFFAERFLSAKPKEMDFSEISLANAPLLYNFVRYFRFFFRGYKVDLKKLITSLASIEKNDYLILDQNNRMYYGQCSSTKYFQENGAY